MISWHGIGSFIRYLLSARIHPCRQHRFVNVRLDNSILKTRVMNGSPDSQWWRNATGYQIWPTSFKDSNGDGIGDIPGIISKLDYLKNLGIDLIWLSPVYDSPQHDMGYDVRDYEAIWAKFGTLEDMDELIQGIHDRGMKIIMDLVVNHTSNEHDWFQKSKMSKSKEENPYADWYIWRDPKYEPGAGPDGQPDRKPPNNWRSGFGGSAWMYVPERDQYYFHCALPEQPDLNWEEPEVRKAIYASAIGFWLKRGIDGFRADCVNCYCKDQNFPDAPAVMPGEERQPMLIEHFINGPKMHEWLQEMRTEVLDKYGKDKIVIIGELLATPQDKALQYLRAEPRELAMTLGFDFVHTANAWFTKPHERQRFNMLEFKAAFEKTQGYLEKGAWTTAFLESHDYTRSVSNFGPGDGKQREAAAKMLALLLTTLCGTLFLYQGQEIGMTNVPEAWTASDFRDHQTLIYLDEMNEKYPEDQEMRTQALAGARLTSRDNARTPVQWSVDAHAGFCEPSAHPWIRVNDNHKDVNVVGQTGRDESVLEFWRKMLKLRKKYADVLVRGRFELHFRDSPTVVTYSKCDKTSRTEFPHVLVVLNFSEEETDIAMPGTQGATSWKLVVSTTESVGDQDTLSPWEGRMYLAED